MAARLFWALVSGFLVGVAARSFADVGVAYAAGCAVFACDVVVLGLFERRLFVRGVVAGVFFVAAALGVLRMHIATLDGDSALTARLGQTITIQGVVVAEPDVRDNSVRVSIRTTKLIAPSRADVHAGVLAVLPAHSDVSYGDQVRAWGQLRAPGPFDTGSGRTFNYPQYLAAQGIEYELGLAQAEVVQNSQNVGNPLERGAIWTKETFQRGVSAALPEPEAGLANGITVGDKRGVGTDVSTTFQQVGLVHVLVLSGYNITVVLDTVAWLLSSASRYVQFGASGFVVSFFILMAGGAGAATRAGIMALVVVLARATRRQFLASRALGLAAFIIVLWNPFELAFDPSFQLSALATLGLIIFSPVIAPYLTRVPEKFALREIISSTLSTQLAVLPLLLYQNGQLPIYSLFANLLALVAVPLAMLFSFIAGVLGIALGHLAVPLAFPAYLLLAYIITVARIFAALPLAAISLPAFSAWWMIIAYAILFAGAWVLYKKEGRAT